MSNNIQLPLLEHTEPSKRSGETFQINAPVNVMPGSGEGQTWKFWWRTHSSPHLKVSDIVLLSNSNIKSGIKSGCGPWQM